MAYKSVVVDSFFDGIIVALEKVEATMGAFALAILVPSYPEIGSWDLQVAAPWLEGKRSSRSSAEIRGALELALGTLSNKLGLVRVRNLDSQIVQTLHSAHLRSSATWYSLRCNLS